MFFASLNYTFRIATSSYDCCAIRLTMSGQDPSLGAQPSSAAFVQNSFFDWAVVNIALEESMSRIGFLL